MGFLALLIWLPFSGGLSLFDESVTLHEGFTKPSRGPREAFAVRVFEKASRSLQGASHEPFAEVYEPFAGVAHIEGSTKTPWRVHEASSKGPWMNCMFLLDDACSRVWSILYCFFAPYATHIGEPILIP